MIISVPVQTADIRTELCGAPAVLNAANEVAVEAFLAGRLPFVGIHGVIADTLGVHSAQQVEDLPSLLRADEQARRLAQSRVMALAA